MVLSASVSPQLVQAGSRQPLSNLMSHGSLTVSWHTFECVACDEFGLQTSKGLPYKPIVVEEQYSCDVIDNTITTNAQHSPYPTVVLLLLEPPPASLSQVLIHRPWFNGHKPLLFNEGER